MATDGASHGERPRPSAHGDWPTGSGFLDALSTSDRPTICRSVQLFLEGGGSQHPGSSLRAVRKTRLRIGVGRWASHGMNLHLGTLLVKRAPRTNKLGLQL